jgi:hypothetical protein
MTCNIEKRLHCFVLVRTIRRGDARVALTMPKSAQCIKDYSDCLCMSNDRIRALV